MIVYEQFRRYDMINDQIWLWFDDCRWLDSYCASTWYNSPHVWHFFLLNLSIYLSIYLSVCLSISVCLFMSRSSTFISGHRGLCHRCGNACWGDFGDDVFGSRRQTTRDVSQLFLSTSSRQDTWYHWRFHRDQCLRNKVEVFRWRSSVCLFCLVEKQCLVSAEQYQGSGGHGNGWWVPFYFYFLFSFMYLLVMSKSSSTAALEIGSTQQFESERDVYSHPPP